MAPENYRAVRSLKEKTTYYTHVNGAPSPGRNGNFQGRRKKCKISREHLTAQKNGRLFQLKDTVYWISLDNVRTKKI